MRIPHSTFCYTSQQQSCLAPQHAAVMLDSLFQQHRHWAAMSLFEQCGCALVCLPFQAGGKNLLRFACRNILAIVGPSGSGKSALVAALSGRLYKPAKLHGQVMISGREAYEAYKPTWFSAADVLTSHLTVHQYLTYKGTWYLIYKRCNQ